MDQNRDGKKGKKLISPSSSNNAQYSSELHNQFDDDPNSYLGNNEYDPPTSQDYDDELGDSIPKVIYSCSYGTNTLVNSEISD